MKKSELTEKWWFRLVKTVFILVAVVIYVTSIFVFYSDWPQKEVVTSQSYFKCLIQFDSNVGDNLIYPFDKNQIYSFDVNKDGTLDSLTRNNTITTCRNVEQQKISEATSTFSDLYSTYSEDAYRQNSYINDQNDINYILKTTKKYNESRLSYVLRFIGWTIGFGILLRLMVFMFYYVVCGKNRFE